MYGIYLTAVCASFFIIEDVACSTTKYTKCDIKLDLSICTAPPSNSSSNSSVECNTEAPQCLKQFNITHIDLKPFDPRILSSVVQMCCGYCTNVRVVNTVGKISDVTKAVMNTSHFVFPVLGRQDTPMLYGYRFLPLIEPPHLFYITHKQHDLMNKLLMSCLSMYPLLIVCALMVIVSGVLCWFMETWTNKDEFPRGFLTGWFEGVWWSFISMTTVGYGDKAPKSVQARIFSIIWITVGITTFSLVTASLTSEIITANTPAPPTMESARVGAIRHHMYEAIVVINEGGILVDIEANNVTDGVQRMVEMLHKEEIDGFALDAYELLLFYYAFTDDLAYKNDVKYLRRNIISSEGMEAKQYSYGVLVKNEDDYQFLVDFVTSNKDVVDGCNRLFLNKNNKDVRINYEKPSLFSTQEGSMFWPSFITCSVVVAILFTCGIVFELQRRKHCCANNRKCSNGLMEKYETT